MFLEEQKRPRKSKAKKKSCKAKSTLFKGLSFVMNRRKMIVKFRTVLRLDLYTRKAILFCLNMLQQRQSMKRRKQVVNALYCGSTEQTSWMKKVAMPTDTKQFLSYLQKDTLSRLQKLNRKSICLVRNDCVLREQTV